MGQVIIRFWNQKKVRSLGTEQGIPCLRVEDFWLTAARNVLKLVVKSEWKSYSIQAEEEEIPGKNCAYLHSPTHVSSHPSIRLFIHKCMS